MQKLSMRTTGMNAQKPHVPQASPSMLLANAASPPKPTLQCSNEAHTRAAVQHSPGRAETQTIACNRRCCRQVEPSALQCWLQACARRKTAAPPAHQKSPKFRLGSRKHTSRRRNRVGDHSTHTTTAGMSDRLEAGNLMPCCSAGNAAPTLAAFILLRGIIQCEAAAHADLDKTEQRTCLLQSGACRCCQQFSLGKAQQPRLQQCRITGAGKWPLLPWLPGNQGSAAAATPWQRQLAGWPACATLAHTRAW